MSQTEQKSQVLECLPEIAMIEDADLRESVVRIWERALAESKWSSLAEATKSPEVDRKLVPHVRAVTQEAVACAEIVSKLHDIPYSRDRVLAIALLHDVSKLLEYEPNESRGAKSHFGKRIQHGTYGAHLMWDEGLDTDLVHAVISHTKASTVVPATWEAVVVYYVDAMDSDALLGFESKPLLLQK